MFSPIVLLICILSFCNLGTVIFKIIDLFLLVDICLILASENVQQWVDLARYTGLQARKSKTSLYQAPDPPNHAALECTTSDEASIDEIKNQ